MNTKRVFPSIGLMILFGTFGLTQFTQNMRPVQVVGLFACGVAVGSALSVCVAALRNRSARRG